ncbi:unnamed protein product [Rotaria socialis]|uniref:Uncharacterized protein n=1 Tax=Rotaria socialis TaxID=392032 RepID=A0A820AIN3_9BILA|nr:unnamed protein product [Rotaria socialis]CAF4178267.1 unnamed protein product [Rotaria socialis]
MVFQDKKTQTDQFLVSSREFSGLKLKHVLKFLSSLLLPLALGVFTLIISLQQQQLAKQQREEDRNASKQQRIEDREATERLREQDRNLSQQQRIEDRIAAEQLREQDRNSSQQQRIEDRIAAEQLRQLERTLTNERYQKEVLDTYIKEIGKLLEKNHGSLISNEVAATLARAKTLNIFRKLDSQYNVHIIRFLYEAKQLTELHEHPSLDLSTAELHDMDFRDSAINKRILKRLSMTSIFLTNATFIGIEMEHVNFADTQFDTVNFSSAKLRHVNFSHARFDHANFSFTSLMNTTFSLSQLKNINFSSTRHEDVDFRFAALENIDFSSSQLKNDLSYTQNLFLGCALASADFSVTRASDTDFQQVYCVAARFNKTDLSSSCFRQSNVKRALFIDADLTDVSFLDANLYKANFSETTITDEQLRSALSIQNAVLRNGTLVHDTNLINNGQADCNIPLVNHWTLLTGNIITMKSDNNTSNCRFVLQALNTSASMFQRLNLSKRWNSTSWSYTQVVFSAQMSPNVSIELRGINVNDSVVARQALSFNKENVTMILRKDMRGLEIFIEFNVPVNQSTTSYWCDDIRLFIVYDAYGEFQQVVPDISLNAQWANNGVTVAGGNGSGNTINQISSPHGFFIDDDQTMVIADFRNHRIVQWKMNDTNGQVVAGGHGRGNLLHQLNQPTDVLIEKETDSLIICDMWNLRVLQWSRRHGTTHGEILVDNINCWGLAMDNQKCLYISDTENDEVRRYQMGDNNGTVVAGGHEKGDGLNQLDFPTYIFVDRQQSVYVSDYVNHRVMKWNKGAAEGITVAGGQGQGSALTQLSYPNGLFVDTLNSLYVADRENNRVMRWSQGAKQGSVMVGGNGRGEGVNQFHYLEGLSFDRYGNLYVVDHGNHRVQCFSIQ